MDIQFLYYMHIENYIIIGFAIMLGFYISLEVTLRINKNNVAYI